MSSTLRLDVITEAQKIELSTLAKSFTHSQYDKLLKYARAIQGERWDKEEFHKHLIGHTLAIIQKGIIEFMPWLSYLRYDNNNPPAKLKSRQYLLFVFFKHELDLLKMAQPMLQSAMK